MKRFFRELLESFRVIYKKNDKGKMDKETEECMEEAVRKNRSLLLFVSIWAALFQLFNLFRVFVLSDAGISTPVSYTHLTLPTICSV